VVKESMRLGLTIPIATHEALKRLAFQRSAEAGKAVPLADLYAEGVHRLAAQIDNGETIVFPIEPKGTVKKVTLRLPPATFEVITRLSHMSSQSAIVAKAGWTMLQESE